MQDVHIAHRLENIRKIWIRWFILTTEDFYLKMTCYDRWTRTSHQVKCHLDPPDEKNQDYVDRENVVLSVFVTHNKERASTVQS